MTENSKTHVLTTVTMDNSFTIYFEKIEDCFGTKLVQENIWIFCKTQHFILERPSKSAATQGKISTKPLQRAASTADKLPFPWKFYFSQLFSSLFQKKKRDKNNCEK